NNKEIALRDKGIDVRCVDDKGWLVRVDDILAQVDDNTKLVMTSHVSFKSGAKIDYESLYKEILKTNALLLLDVTQSLGVTPVEMYSADFVVCSSYTWLLSVAEVARTRWGVLHPIKLGREQRDLN